MSSRNGSMWEKVIVITGATSGIGQAAAERLASMGARLVLVARSKERGEATLARLDGVSPGTNHTVYYADLSLMAEAQRVGNEIAVAEPRIDVLINNAGALISTRHVTDDGLELTFALNHMSYFILTECLRDKLAPNARVVNTSSEAHRGAKFKLENLKSPKRFGSFKAYSLSKLCNILFTHELARHLDGTGITVNCLHPGFVRSRFFENKTGPISVIFNLMLFLAITPEKAAETVVYLASSDEVSGVTGKYFSKCREKTPTREARNDKAAAELWEESARLWASG
jgi:NAD(P)-dependent dehydrogenase (short-subunit alcohol dehydrogenase family)